MEGAEQSISNAVKWQGSQQLSGYIDCNWAWRQVELSRPGKVRKA